VVRKVRHLQHPDVQFILPTPAQSNLKEDELRDARREIAANPYKRADFGGKNTFIGIDTIRELKHEARFKLYEGRRKVFIISEADTLRIEAANALLKLLEEPPDNLMLILVTANIHRMLPTIRSRCQTVRFSRLEEQALVDILKAHAPKADPATLPSLARLSGFNLKRAFDFLNRDVIKIRDNAIDFLRKAVLLHRGQEIMQIIEATTARRDLEEARLLLWFLLLWFQDLLHLRSNPDKSQPLYNADQLTTLERFMGFTANADIAAIVWDIEKAVQAINDPRNYNPQLIFTDLAIALHRHLRG
ncbi:MAG TPA: hypothetical protein PKV71_09540, partial [Calditrichia bacterium]|nr:hypothetical protein [Calditrichia bacterium]